MHPVHRLIELPEHIDARGHLLFGQESDHIPFPVKRFFVLHDIVPGATRGGHAHRAQHQLLIALSGAVMVTVDNGHERNDAWLDRPNLALYAPPMLWLDLGNFQERSCLLVLTSGIYAEADYIRERAEFERLTRG